MDYTKEWVRYRKFDDPDSVAGFIQHYNVTVISITQSGEQYTVFYC